MINEKLKQDLEKVSRTLVNLSCDFADLTKSLEEEFSQLREEFIETQTEIKLINYELNKEKLFKSKLKALIEEYEELP